jgi:hypothetical protein
MRSTIQDKTHKIKITFSKLQMKKFSIWQRKLIQGLILLLNLILKTIHLVKSQMKTKELLITLISTILEKTYNNSNTINSSIKNYNKCKLQVKIFPQLNILKEVIICLKLNLLFQVETLKNHFIQKNLKCIR